MEFDKGSSILYTAFWDEGRQMVRREMREPIPAIKFLPLYNAIEVKWKPKGEYNLAELYLDFI